MAKWKCTVCNYIYDEEKEGARAEFGTAFVNPDFADFAKSCGGEGYRVEKPGELDWALERAFKSANPVIVDVLVDPDEMAPIVKTAED